MTGKGGRVRRTRRTNTHDEDQETITTTKHHADETIDQSDDNKSTMSNDTDKLDTSSSITKEETNGHEPSSPPSETQKDKDPTPTKLKEVDDDVIIETIEKTNGQSEVPTTDKQQPEQPIKNGDEQSSGEVESINIDSEDPELQFTSEQNSDKSSEVELSPTLNRCRTRRSHTRNLPTPKTPKVPDLNGDLAEETEKLENFETPEVVITIPDEVEENSENVSLASNISIDGSIGEKTFDVDLANASIFVNLGNDTTKNFDITVQSHNYEQEEEEEEAEAEAAERGSNFLETTKDKSYGETLRCLTGRKTSRNFNLPPRMYSSTIDLTDSSKKYTPSVGVKRKLDSENPSDKRMRTEDVSPGILSYLTSPFKNKISGRSAGGGGGNEVPSSTPKLTSFKYVHHGSTVIDEVNKNDLVEGDDNKSTEPRKWCSIM